MTRVELLRDLYVWAYERSTQEYLAIKQDLAEPDPLRLAWRDFIKQTIREVILHPEREPLACNQQAVSLQVPVSEQSEVQALVVEELRRLHKGVLARYGLSPSEFNAWKNAKLATANKNSDGKIRLDTEVMDWLKAMGPRHYSRINGLLMALMEADRKYRAEN